MRSATAEQVGAINLLLTGILALAAPLRAGEAPEMLTVPGFGRVALYAPPREPRQVVLFVSGDGGWNLGVVSMAERLRDEGALVAGIDVRAFRRTLEGSGSCAYPAGPLEELSRAVQLHRRLPAYERPILVGYSSGATLVYAAIAGAPPEAFAGAISLGFCPKLEIRKAPCRTRGLEHGRGDQRGYELSPFADLQVPWMVLQGEVDQVCSARATRDFVMATGSSRFFPLPKVGHGFAVSRNWDSWFVEAYEAVAARPRPSPREVPALGGLSLEEVRTRGAESDQFAVILTGDGGWAEIDKRVAEGLAAGGVSVVGWSSLGYFWKPRTPEGASADLARIIEHYSAAWGKSRVVLVGYSFGADVLPFLVNRLPPATRARVERLVLLGPSETAAFEFHVGSWLGWRAEKGRPVRPEVERLVEPVLCVQGRDEANSACRGLVGARVEVVSVGSGHHFGGDYRRLAELILRFVIAALAPPR
jgi:type IV secretory pathway VirJ component